MQRVTNVIMGIEPDLLCNLVAVAGKRGKSVADLCVDVLEEYADSYLAFSVTTAPKQSEDTQAEGQGGAHAAPGSETAPASVGAEQAAPVVGPDRIVPAPQRNPIDL